MPRGLDATTLTEIQKEATYIVNFVEFHLDSVSRFTTAHMDITYDVTGEGSQTYVASPSLISFGDVNESIDLSANSMTFVRSAVDQSNLAEALSQDPINKVVKLYRGYLNTTTYAIIGTPQLIYTGRIRSYNVAENIGDTATITWNTTSIFADFLKTAGRRANHEDQQIYLETHWIHTGQATSAHATILTDTNANFVISGNIKDGDPVLNVTDGSSATIVGSVSNTALQLTALTGGTLNTWNIGDDYKVGPPVDKGFEFTHITDKDIKWGRA